MLIVQSPGRINIIGEHTDYNEGFVLPAAIDKNTVIQVRKNNTDSTVQVHALNVDEHFAFDLNNFVPIESGWPNYIMGVVHELQKLGAKLRGFDVSFKGDIPIGAGMSSSAALECSLAYSMNELFNLGFDKLQLIKASQMAEHNFVGIKCGIMDQFASMMGKKDQVILLDCRTMEYQFFPFDLGKYQILLINTNVSHKLASSEYNTRRAECELGVKLIQQKYSDVNSLRDVSLKKLQTCLDDLPDMIYKRCHHVVSENDRVLEATKALTGKDFHLLGKLMYQSHFSLQKDYEVSCAELDFLIQCTLDKDYIIGARMMGGGFGGCTINIIEQSRVAIFKEFVSDLYLKEFGKKLTPYSVSIENGTSILNF